MEFRDYRKYWEFVHHWPTSYLLVAIGTFSLVGTLNAFNLFFLSERLEQPVHDFLCIVCTVLEFFGLWSNIGLDGFFDVLKFFGFAGFLWELWNLGTLGTFFSSLV